MGRNTSPYDAIAFFMHHLFVDCNWWSWQEKNGGQNRDKYSGIHHDTDKAATINDACPMLGLGGKDVAVMDLLHADRAPNCFSVSARKA
jgi:hypothetical protein